MRDDTISEMMAGQPIPQREAAALRAAIATGGFMGFGAVSVSEAVDDLSLVQGVLDAIPTAVYFMDPDGRFLACNCSFERFSGVTRELLLGRCARDLWPAAIAESYLAADARPVDGVATHEHEAEFQTVDGVRHEVVFHSASLRSADGAVVGLVGVIVDVSERNRVERRLRESEARFRELASQALVGIVLIEDGRISYSNARFDEMFGYSPQEVRELEPVAFAVKSDRARVAENIRRRTDGETDHLDYVFGGLRKDGAVIDIECHGGTMNVSGKRLLVSLMLDITERTRAERELQSLQQRLRDQATHDALTGLHNRGYLEEALRRELILAERSALPVSLIMGDLDRFKEVNDQFGHPAGDEVLRTFGALLARQARGSDIYCRYGGEEFLLVLPGMPAASAEQRAEQLRRALASSPIAYRASKIAVTASFGIAAFPRDGRSAEELIAAADNALYAAKFAGRNRVVLAGPSQRPRGA